MNTPPFDQFPESHSESLCDDPPIALERRVPREKALEAQAAMAGISKTRLGRILILDGLEKLEAGSLRLREPGLEEAQ